MNRQQEVNKHAKIAMVIISGIIIFLFIVALMGCNSHTAHKDIYVPRDTLTQDTVPILIQETQEGDGGFFYE